MFAFILYIIVSNHVSVVDNLVSNYGQGESHLQKCPTCEYEEELKTSGVHVSEGQTAEYGKFRRDLGCGKNTMEGRKNVPRGRLKFGQWRRREQY